MTRYLLPCVCGRRIPVAANQAGEQLQCECGQKLEVPTLRHLAALERIEERGAAPPRERSWGARQGLVFLGASLILVAAGCLVYLQLRKPAPITNAIVKTNVEAMPPAFAWAFWSQLERGINRPPNPYEVGTFIQHKEAMDNWEGLRLAALVAAAAGVLLINIGFFLVRGSRRGRVLL